MTSLDRIEPRRILVRAPNWVGDVVMATPALFALRQRYPDAFISLSIRPYARALVDGLSAIDDVTGPSPQDPSGWRGALQLGKRLRREEFDLAILFTNSFTTALEVFAARIPHRLGYRGDGRRFLLTHSLPKARRWDEAGRLRPMVDYYGDLVTELGGRVEDRRYRLEVRADQDAAVDAWMQRQGLQGDGPLFGLNPGAKAGASKLWLPERFAEVGDRLTEKFGGTAVLLGGPGEEALLAGIAARMRGPVVNSGEDILDLGSLKAFLPRLALLVTNDTGPRAMGQAFGVPEVVLCGPYDTGLTEANNERARILGVDLPCRPCNRPVCPLDHHACMTELGTDLVLDAATDLLGKSS